jgi:hypothetical protein
LKVENPPVATVAKEWHTLSKRSISPRLSRKVSAAVRHKYTNNNLKAMDFVLGSIFSFNDDSRLISCCAVILRDGSMIITRRMIPNPPIQWVMLLQNRMDFGSISIFESIDAPVVVKPDAAS